MSFVSTAPWSPFHTCSRHAPLISVIFLHYWLVPFSLEIEEKIVQMLWDGDALHSATHMWVKIWVNQPSQLSNWIGFWWWFLILLVKNVSPSILPSQTAWWKSFLFDYVSCYSASVSITWQNMQIIMDFLSKQGRRGENAIFHNRKFKTGFPTLVLPIYSFAHLDLARCRLYQGLSNVFNGPSSQITIQSSS